MPIVLSWTTYKRHFVAQNSVEMNEKEKLEKFGKNVAKYRRARKLTQNQLAELLDISREHLAKIETAKRGISISLLFKMGEVLSISEKELFNFK